MRKNYIRYALIHKKSIRISYSLVVLLLGNLLNLVQKLSHPQLQLGQLFFLSNVGIVYGMFSNLDVQMNPLKSKCQKKLEK